MGLQDGEKARILIHTLSGKTRFYVKPNLMQMHSSYVVTDPKGLTSYGQRK